ncbi:tripartite motif-containing protein 59-like isoform X2 [Protopterus annectens]|uniref:tripartite motif-containing protein 59-like isoform X2 n=1 Tax=Protopterus annectens TaxID=7888 RepID=UPI001CFAEB21|nr:tripartite motif-containing protein 59-like isoform X2 [Protopterus annectens]
MRQQLRLHYYNKMNANIETCPICRESFNDPKTLLCGHTFCNNCIKQLGPVNGPWSCAMCRKVSPHLTTVFVLKNLLEQCQYMETEKDIMECPHTHSIAISMNKSFVMNSGVGLIFKKQFNQIDELKSQGKQVGEVAVLQQRSRFLYYMITRSTYAFKPNYENVQKCLHAVKEHCLENDVMDLAMPNFFSARTPEPLCEGEEQVQPPFHLLQRLVNCALG